MMECEHLRSRLGSYLAHELPLDERSLVRQHLDQCTRCQDELATLEKLDQLLDLQPVLVPPVELSASIMAVIAQPEVEKAKDLTVRQVLVWGTTLTAGLLLVLLPLAAWWWQARTGLTLVESLTIWRGASASGVAGAKGLWSWLLVVREWLLSSPQLLANWLQGRGGIWADFYGRHVLQIGLAAVVTVITAVASLLMLKRWTDRWDEGMEMVRRSRSN